MTIDLSTQQVKFIINILENFLPQGSRTATKQFIIEGDKILEILEKEVSKNVKKN
jgi:hypothetical protein